MILHFKGNYYFQDLKKICWGGADRPIKENWTKQGIYFNPAEKLFSYGLKTEKNETKTLLMCLQAYLLKPLLFAENEKENKRYNCVIYFLKNSTFLKEIIIFYTVILTRKVEMLFSRVQSTE